MRIDVVCVRARVTGQNAEIDHRGALLLPKNRVMILGCRTRQVRFADNISGIIDPVRYPVVATKSAQILQACFLRPEEGMRRQVPRHVRGAYDLPAIIESRWVSQGAAQRADIQHVSLLPKERVCGGKTCG